MVEITWLGHGTFQLKLESGEVVIIDPWLDGNPAYPKGPSIERVDAILISHGHFDHIHDVFRSRSVFSRRWSAFTKPAFGWRVKA